MVTIALPDDSRIQVADGSTVHTATEQIGPGLAKAALAARLDGDALIDLNSILEADCSLEIITPSSPEALEILRHSTAHIMATAVKKLFPEVKFAIGPAIDAGFYYDIDIGRPLNEDDLKQIEKEMKSLIKANIPFERQDIDRLELLEKMRADGEIYKAELLEEIDADTVSIYQTGAFIDLCRGPHIPSAGKIKAFKLQSIAGAYWRGKSDNPMLQRIYGTAFFSKNELKEHLHLLEEARKRDHRRIGAQMDLFSFHEQAPGFPFWHPQGMILYNEVVRFWKEVHDQHSYSEIKTPIILNEDLWHISGHWDNYKDNMYFTSIDERANAVKPMNCPGGLLIFANTMHSYRDFPMRVAELGLVHRHELSGVLHGLFRVRAFTQDDAHIFCTPDQIESEVVGVIKLFIELYTAFGLSDYRFELSTRPEKSIGSDAEWERSEIALKNALETAGLDYELNPGDGAFYGPKIDFHINDCMNRSWQCGTVQLDFSMPRRFADAGMNIHYVDSANTHQTPVMLHRAALGSLERFIGILIEEFGGKFPLWLAPVQAVIANITDAQQEYAQQLAEDMKKAGLRVKLDLRNEKLGYKIREAITSNVPYILVVGDQEVEAGAVNVRHRSVDNIGTKGRDKVIDTLAAEYRQRSLTSLFTDSN